MSLTLRQQLLTIIEAAYRRGFQQGFTYAEARPDKLNDCFSNGLLHDWRYNYPDKDSPVHGHESAFCPVVFLNSDGKERHAIESVEERVKIEFGSRDKFRKAVELISHDDGC